MIVTYVQELKCAVEWNVEEGEMIDDDMIDNEVVATVQGPGRNILLGERTALNIVTRLANFFKKKVLFFGKNVCYKLLEHPA